MIHYNPLHEESICTLCCVHVTILVAHWYRFLYDSSIVFVSCRLSLDSLKLISCPKWVYYEVLRYSLPIITFYIYYKIQKEGCVTL